MVGERLAASNRRHVDDGARLALRHALQHSLHTIQHAQHVGVQHGLPLSGLSQEHEGVSGARHTTQVRTSWSAIDPNNMTPALFTKHAVGPYLASALATAAVKALEIQAHIVCV